MSTISSGALSWKKNHKNQHTHTKDCMLFSEMLLNFKRTWCHFSCLLFNWQIMFCVLAIKIWCGILCDCDIFILKFQNIKPHSTLIEVLTCRFQYYIYDSVLLSTCFVLWLYCVEYKFWIHLNFRWKSGLIITPINSVAFRRMKIYLTKNSTSIDCFVLISPKNSKKSTSN